MKTSRVKLFLLATTLPLFLVGCAGIGPMARQYDDRVQMQAQPEVLEVHADSIPYTVNGTIPPNYMHRRATLRLEPTLRFSGRDLPLEPVYFRGENASGVAGQQTRQVSRREGTNFNVSGKIPYEPQMRESHLIMVPMIRMESRYQELEQCFSPPEDTLARGVIATSQTVKPTDDLLFAGDTEPDRSDRVATIYYQINRAEIRDTSIRKAEVQDQFNFILENRDQVQGITVISYASPDGEVRFNDRLSQQRTRSAHNLVNQRLRRARFDRIHDTAFYRQTSVTEDWAGFRRAVANDDFPQRNEVLRIIDDRTLTDEQKEAQIRETGAWDYLARNIFPPLRRSEIRVHTVAEVREQEEVLAIGATNLGDLNRTELLIFGLHAEDTPARARAYQRYMTEYPDDWVGPNNYAAILILQGEYDQAHTMLQDAQNRWPDNDTLLNNLGVAKRHIREYQMAREYYNRAQRAGIEQNNNLGILNIKTADYQGATQSFERDRCDYNSALAFLLAGNHDEAERRIDCIVDKTADDFYLRAIVGARKGDRNLMTTSLTRAVQMDPDIRQRARSDMEFRNYWETTEFTNALR